MESVRMNRVAVIHFLIFLIGAFFVYGLASKMSHDKVTDTKRAIASSKNKRIL